MLFVNIKGKDTAIIFRHHKQVVQHKEAKQTHPFKTTCSIMTSKENCVASGEATVSPEDNFNYESGRTISLTRAMNNAGFDKATRSMVWDAYRNR